MQISGKILVLATFAIGFAMAGVAWWYNYQQSSRTAAFWGPRDATLIVGSQQVELLELAPATAPSAEGETTPTLIAGRAAANPFELTNKPGLVHLRYALTYDPDFNWSGRRTEPVSGATDWAYALRFTTQDRQLAVLFTRDFTQLGHVDERAGTVDVLPCPALGPVVREYLGKVGVTLPALAPR